MLGLAGTWLQCGCLLFRWRCTPLMGYCDLGQAARKAGVNQGLTKRKEVCYHERIDD